MRYIGIDKISKKLRKKFYAENRVVTTFNIGTRTMKTSKNPSRNLQKALDRKEIREYN